MIDKEAWPVQPKTATVVEAEEFYACCFHVSTTSEFPGGTEAWRQFIQQNLVYPADAVKAAIEGTVVVLFTVDKDGTLYDIEAISGPDALKESAVELVRKSPNWKPGIINGRYIKDRHQQLITFQLQEEEPE